MGLVVTSSFAIMVVVVVLFLAVRADRRRRRLRDTFGRHGIASHAERRQAEQRFVQALEVQDFDRAESEVRLILSGR